MFTKLMKLIKELPYQLFRHFIMFIFMRSSKFMFEGFKVTRMDKDGNVKEIVFYRKD